MCGGGGRWEVVIGIAKLVICDFNTLSGPLKNEDVLLPNHLTLVSLSYCWGRGGTRKVEFSCLITS